jgi:hypothetical protein
VSEPSINAVPVLGQADLEAALAELAQQDHAQLVTVFGRGCGALEVVAGGTKYAVHEVQSELQLRALLPPLTEPIRQPLAFVVPWTGKLPSDIAGEFKASGRPRVIRLRDRVARLFRAHSAHPELDRSALPPYLLAHYAVGAQPSFPPVVGVLGRRQLWELFIKSGLGVETGAGLALDALLAWAVRDGRGPDVRRELRERGGEAVRSELLEELGRMLGQLGPVVWQAWERGEGRALLEYGLLFEVLRGVDDRAVRVWQRMVVAPALDIPVDESLNTLVSELGALTTPALRLLQRHEDGAGRVRSLLQGAERLLAALPELEPHVPKSAWLPSAVDALMAQLGEHFERLAAEPDAIEFSAARATFEKLAHHRLFDDDGQKPRLQRAEMALRLSAWLCAPSHNAYAGGRASFSDVEALGRWYTEEGGYIDWARRAARGSANDAFGRGVKAVVDRVDALRRSLDLRFARGLAAWLDAGRPAAGVLPIEDAVQRLAEPFLAEREDRRLLVLLMDGMAWSQAVQLLEGLAPSGWGPLRWKPGANGGNRRGALGSGAYPGLFAPVMAALPTMTNVSRAAFFAGACVPSGKAAPPTDVDTDRWAAHESARRFDRTPCLLLRGTGHNADGSASTLALSRVADRAQRVVAIVINAIDASLKGDAQVSDTWRPEDIRSLRDLLEAAREAGRSVLLASDHGHVPGDCLTEYVTSPQPGGARWRPLDAANPAVNSEFEVRVPASQVWAPPGATAIALLADDQHRYTPQCHAGEHGGATLAEVMAPCVLIGVDVAPESLLDDDPSLQVRGPHVPEWWLYNLPKAPARRPSKKPSRPKLPAVSPQLQLSDAKQMPPARPEPVAAPEVVAVPIAAAGASTVSEAALRISERLLDNDAFKLNLPPAPHRERILRALQYLWDSGGEVGPQGLASAVDLPVRRVAGLVALLGKVVNLDGFVVVRVEPSSNVTATTIRFNRELLCELFEVQP